MLQDLELTVTADLKHITVSCVRLYRPREFAGFSFLRGKIHDQPNAVPFFFFFLRSASHLCFSSGTAGISET